MQIQFGSFGLFANSVVLNNKKPLAEGKKVETINLIAFTSEYFKYIIMRHLNHYN
jgi:hypothetical protein